MPLLLDGLPGMSGILDEDGLVCVLLLQLDVPSFSAPSSNLLLVLAMIVRFSSMLIQSQRVASRLGGLYPVASFCVPSVVSQRLTWLRSLRVGILGKAKLLTVLESASEGALADLALGWLRSLSSMDGLCSCRANSLIDYMVATHLLLPVDCLRQACRSVPSSSYVKAKISFGAIVQLNLVLARLVRPKGSRLSLRPLSIATSSPTRWQEPVQSVLKLHLWML